MTDLSSPPTAEQWAEARSAAGHTYHQVAEAVGVTRRQAQKWQSGDARAPIGVWWLYLLRTGQATLEQLPCIPARSRSHKRDNEQPNRTKG